jgi:hypothetical protein
MFDVCTTGDTAHIDTIFKLLPHTRQHKLKRVSRTWNIVSMRAVSPMVHTQTSLVVGKNFFSFPVAVNNFIKVGPLAFLLQMFVITEDIMKRPVCQVPKDAHWLVEEQLAFLGELYSMEIVNFVHKKPTLKSVHPVNTNCISLKWSKKSLMHRWKTCLKITLEKVWKRLTIWFHFINTDVHYNIIY